MREGEHDSVCWSDLCGDDGVGMRYWREDDGVVWREEYGVVWDGIWRGMALAWQDDGVGMTV